MSEPAMGDATTGQTASEGATTGDATAGDAPSGRSAKTPPDHAKTERLARLAFITLCFAIALAGVLHVLYYFPRTVDDMFIYLRYAENVAAGQGLVYNVGEAVEGYSGPLWMLWLSMGTTLGLDGLVVAKVLGIGSLVVLALGVYRLGRERFDLRPRLALVPVFALALNSYVLSWGLWGLETPAYLACIVWAAVWMQRRAESRPASQLQAAPKSQSHAASGSRRAFWGLALSAGCLLLSRPEAPLFAGAIGIAEVFRGKDFGEQKARLRRLIGPSAAATGALVAYLIFRRVYFGLWLPHTHYAKEGEGFDPGHLAPFVAQGASVYEIAAFALALVGAFYLIKKRRDALPFLVILAVAFFVGMVERDWMPNVRHFLPVQVLLPVALVGAASLSGRRWVIMAATAITLVAAFDIAQVDSRYSLSDFRTHGRGENWRKEKSAEVWADTWACLNGEWPEHVKAMGPFNHGMISQLYALLEADERPLTDVWFIARDIGRVGWLSPARIFDTDGLFTPDVVDLGAETVSDEVLLRAFARPVAMTELYGPWAGALRLAPVRDHYEPRPDGGHLAARNLRRPSPEMVLARYEAALAKMPSSYLMMTLYGEGVGAAVQKRVALIRELAGDAEDSVTLDAPAFDDRAVRLDTDIDLLGCETPQEVRVGNEVTLSCYYRSVNRTTRDYTVFVHVLGGPMIHADHLPVGGFLPTDEWRPGTVVRDRFRFHVPADFPGDELSPRIGLYIGNHRARAVEQHDDAPDAPQPPSERIDSDGRVVLPAIRVTR